MNPNYVYSMTPFFEKRGILKFDPSDFKRSTSVNIVATSKPCFVIENTMLTVLTLLLAYLYFSFNRSVKKIMEDINIENEEIEVIEKEINKYDVPEKEIAVHELDRAILLFDNGNNQTLDLVPYSGEYSEEAASSTNYPVFKNKSLSSLWSDLNNKLPASFIEKQIEASKEYIFNQLNSRVPEDNHFKNVDRISESLFNLLDSTTVNDFLEYPVLPYLLKMQIECGAEANSIESLAILD